MGGPILTRSFRILLAIAALGGVMMLWRFAAGLAAVSNLNDGYPWGIWIAFDVVTGTALGCGGFAVALLVYILNKGEYHPLVRPAILTSLLGYGLAVLAVTVDLGRFWELWKVPVFFWRWSHSPQLEVALCVATYVLVLLIELSPAFFEKWRKSPDSGLRSFAERGLAPRQEVLRLDPGPRDPAPDHAPVLARDHFHLVIETPEKTLSRGMQWLERAVRAGGSIERHKRVGHLFQGRFHGELVREGIAPSGAGALRRAQPGAGRDGRAPGGVPVEQLPRDGRAGGGAGVAGDRMDPSAVQRPIGSARSRSTRKFVDAGVGIERSPWDDVVGQIYLGTAEWIERMQALDGRGAAERGASAGAAARRDGRRCRGSLRRSRRRSRARRTPCCSRADPCRADARGVAGMERRTAAPQRDPRRVPPPELRNDLGPDSPVRARARARSEAPHGGEGLLARASPRSAPAGSRCLPRPQTGNCVPVRPVGSGREPVSVAWANRFRSRGRAPSWAFRARNST